MHYCSKKQMSESFLTAAFLSVSGGLQDMYTLFQEDMYLQMHKPVILCCSASIFLRETGQMLCDI